MNAIKPTGRAMSMPGGIGVGTAGAMLWTILGAAVTALLISKEVFDASAIGYGALIILVTAAYISARVSYGKIKHRRTAVMGISGVTYYFSLLAINALFFGGQYAGMGVTAGAVLAGTMSAMLLGKEKGRRRTRSGYKIPKR